MKQPTITARQLRHLLFTLDRQSMTVEELRAILFGADQDKPYTLTDLGCWANAVDTMARLHAEAQHQEGN
jgi:hypothetical protein